MYPFPNLEPDCCSMSGSNCCLLLLVTPKVEFPVPWASLVAQMVNSLPAILETWFARSDRSPGERNGNPLQYSCMKNPMDRRAWQAPAHGGHKELHTAEWLTFRFFPIPCPASQLEFQQLLHIYHVKNSLYLLWNQLSSRVSKKAFTRP